MARKKKIQEVKKPQITDTFKYEGKVTLKLAKGNKPIKTLCVKNLGVNNLFQKIALWLTGNWDSCYPKFLNIGSNNEPTTVNMTDLQSPLLTNRVKLTSRPIYQLNNSTWVAPFQTVVPYSSLSENTAIKELGLFYTELSNNTMLARIVLDDSIIIPQGYNLIIEWLMTISNS